jgi:hypothetical protein
MSNTFKRNANTKREPTMFIHLQSRLTTALSLVGLLALAPDMGAQGPPLRPDTIQDHPGRDWRVRKTTLGRWGDTKVTRYVAEHVVRYAEHRYAIEDIVTPTDRARANGEMYAFLSWKYGNPSAVTAQWISAGYGHFDHHADEGAIALLGGDLPGPGNVAYVPKEVSKWLTEQVKAMATDDKKGLCALLLQSSAGDATYSSTGGPLMPSGAPAGYPSTTGGNTTPPDADGTSLMGIACEYLIGLAAQAAYDAIGRLGISEAALKGKRYDVSDADIALAICARRHPQTCAPPARQRRKR